VKIVLDTAFRSDIIRSREQQQGLFLMPFENKDRDKGRKKSNTLRVGWPSAPKMLHQSNAKWKRLIKHRGFSNMAPRQEVNEILSKKKNKIIELVGNRVFKVAFVKKDGSLREMTCRLDVKSHCGDGEQTADKNRYLVVFDMNTARTVDKQQRKNCYRNVNVETIQYVKVGGKKYS